MTYLVGVDIGGTFTDTFLYHTATGESFRSKTLTTPGDLSDGVMAGLEKAAGQTDLDPNQVSRIVHGSTVATNAIIEGKGARVGLITTRGYEHILHLARSWTPGPLAGWIGMKKPDPLASLEDTVGIRERMSAQGDVVENLDEQHVRDSLRDLERAGIGSLTVCLLNSYANPVHERRIGEIGGEVLPEMPISLSSDLLPEFREYERAMVTVMNAYIQPRVRRYLVDLQARAGETYPEARIDVLRSDGGRMSVDAAVGQPVHMILSGPAGGVSGARRVAEQVGSTNFLTLDMGGTSTDVSIVVDGRPQISRETKVGFFPVSSPAINIRSVGAGGGSIAKVADYSGALRVGPESAGAEPGPACYGRGGVQPTVTDANAVLGYLPAALAGGEMSLDAGAAEAALAPLADALGLSLHEAAGGVVDIVNENMLGALRLVSVEQGYHPADFALIAYGGAGPLHANKLGELLGSFPVVIPATPGILCALGDLASDYRSEFAQSFIRTVDATSLVEVLARLREVGAQAQAWLAGEGIAGGDQRILYEIDVRYHRQGLALPIPVSLGALEDEGLEGVGERFSQAHERAYGFRLSTVVEVVVLRAVAQGVTPEIETASVETGGVDPSAALTGRTAIHHGSRCVEASVFERTSLRAGNVVQGPAIITQMDSTTLVLPGYRGVVDAHGNILIDRGKEMNGTPDGPGPEHDLQVDPVTIDLIENALKSVRREMDAVVFRTAMSPIIREEHDAFPLISDAEGRMIVGQFGWDLGATLFNYFPRDEMHPGDVIIQNDPYLCAGAIQHTPDLLVARPLFHRDKLVGIGSIFGNLADIGTAVPGSMPTTATSIFEEGIRFPPVKLYDAGKLNKAVLDILARNTRLPDMNVADVMALSAAVRLAETRIAELCDRFGRDTYVACTDALLERTRRAMKRLIAENIPERPTSFEDYIDDDGLGNGPFKMKLTYYRKGEKAVFDWTGTSPQAPGPINLMLSEGMFKIDIGVYLIMVYDPEILFNQGYYDLIEVILPPKSLVQPEYPAPLSNRSHTLARKYDVISGALGQNTPELSTAASFGSSPHFLFSGTDGFGRFFHLVEILYGGLPGRPLDDGIDGHSWWPQFENVPSEYLESYYPLRVEKYHCAIDSGGAGYHRGGNGIDKWYRFLAPGSVSLHDDRHRSQPWGLGGGKPGAVSSKTLIRADGSRERVPSKIDNLEVEAGDLLVFVTAGGGGWGDPLERSYDKVGADLRSGLVSADKARREYGIVLRDGGFDLDVDASDALRARMRSERGPLPVIDRGDNPGFAAS